MGSLKVVSPALGPEGLRLGRTGARGIEAATAGVRVSVLCPGVVRTAALTCEARYGKVLPPIPPEVLRRLVEQERPMSPDRFAEKALRAVARNRAIIVIPSWWRVVWWLNRLSPRLGFYLGRKALETTKRAAERLPP